MRRSLASLSMASALLLLSGARAEAEPEAIEGADGANACAALEKKNATELQAFSALQPATPYVYPHPGEILGAPWAEMTDAAKHSSALLAATFIPHIGPVLRGPTPETSFSWPWSIPIGPLMSCSRRAGSYVVSKFRPFRAMIEPGLVGGQQAVALYFRPGFRFIYHPSDWFAGVGGGLGSMIELTGREPVRASFSPEALVQFGRCCEPGYFLFGIRHEFFFAGASQLWIASVGFTYF